MLFPAASVFKVPVLIEFFNQLEEGKVSFRDMVTLSEEGKSIGSGVLSKLSSGGTLPLQDYVTLMMILSDNTATDYIVRLLGKENISRMIASMGLTKTTVAYDCNELIIAGWGMPIDTPRLVALEKMRAGDYQRNEALFVASDAPNNWTTPAEMTEIFRRIYCNEVVSAGACEQMMAIMEKCDTNRRLPYLLPKGGKHAVQKIIHKTGTLHRIVNDAGIIISPSQAYILAVFYNGYNASYEEREGSPGSAFGEGLLAELSRDIYNALHPL